MIDLPSSCDGAAALAISFDSRTNNIPDKMLRIATPSIGFRMPDKIALNMNHVRHGQGPYNLFNADSQTAYQRRYFT